MHKHLLKISAGSSNPTLSYKDFREGGQNYEIAQMRTRTHSHTTLYH